MNTASGSFSRLILTVMRWVIGLLLVVLDICHRDRVWIGVDEFVYRLDAEAIGSAMPTDTGRALDDLRVQLLGRGQRRTWRGVGMLQAAVAGQ